MGYDEVVANKEKEVRLGQLKRKHRRVSLAGFICDIADGLMSAGGVVADVSVGGLKVTDIDDSFLADKHVYTLLLSSDEGKYYRVLAKPCWKKKSGDTDSLEIGFRVVDAPWEWVEFTHRQVPDVEYEDDYVYN